MKIVEMINNDKEIRELKNKIHEKTGVWYPYNYDEYYNLDDYKDKLRKILKEAEGDNM